MTITIKKSYFKVAVIFLMALLSFSLFSDSSFANPPTCTDDGSVFDPSFGEDAFLSIIDVIANIEHTLAVNSAALYFGITGDSGFQSAVAAAATLMIVFYGISIMFGLVPVTFAQAIIRLLKFAFVIALITPLYGYLFLETFVEALFIDGANALINEVSHAAANISVTTICPATTAPFTTVTDPLRILQCVIAEVLNPKTFVLVLATFSAGPYGPIMALALMYALFSLLMAMVRAFQVLALSLIVRYFLFGIAPIFFAFLFFEKTKEIFIGWIRQLVSFSLQPLLLFTFLGFFMQIVYTAIRQITGDIEACWAASARGAPGGEQLHVWGFEVDNQPFYGHWTIDGPIVGDLVDSNNNPVVVSDIFAIHSVDLLVLIIVVYIASEIATVVTQIASEMASGFVRLDADGTAGVDPLRSLQRGAGRR